MVFLIGNGTVPETNIRLGSYGHGANQTDGDR